MSSNEKLKCRQVLYALKYHVANKHTNAEEYAHHVLFMYFLFRYGNELNYSNSYNENLNFLHVLETAKLSLIPYLWKIYRKDYQQINNPTLINLVSKKMKKLDRLDEDFQNLNNDESFVDDKIHADIGLGCSGSTLPLFQDSVIGENICSLNAKQRQLFKVTNKWSRDYMKDLSCKTIKNCVIFFSQGVLELEIHILSKLFIFQLVKDYYIRVAIWKNQGFFFQHQQV